MTQFNDLGLAEGLLAAVAAEGYETATDIQAQAIPPLLAGRDVLGLAQTGTGKTAAFTLPLLQRLAAAPCAIEPGRPRALILAPTRELAEQIGRSVGAYGRNLDLPHTVIFGGVPQEHQVAALDRGVAVLVATPGRLFDLMEQGWVRLGGIEIFVLDEADRMLDMGFVRDIRKMLPLLPAERQTALFSATMPKGVVDLAAGLMRDPVRAEVKALRPTVDAIDQSVLFVTAADKPALLIDLLRDPARVRSIVFIRTRIGAEQVALDLQAAGIAAEAIHGDRTQAARQRALRAFREGTVTALVATDVASRGLDVDDISHVINYDLPEEPESYVHRIGRTGRAGRRGVALSLCEPADVPNLQAIEKTVKTILLVDVDHPYHDTDVARLHGRGGGPGGSRRGQGKAKKGRRPPPPRSSARRG